MATRLESRIPPPGAEPRPAEVRHISPQPWQMEGADAQGCQYRTAHTRRTGWVPAGALEAWALFCQGASRAEACARASKAESRAVEPHASRLNGIPLYAEEPLPGRPSGGRRAVVCTQVAGSYTIIWRPRCDSQYHLVFQRFQLVSKPYAYRV